jgi:hypothetical protein
MIHRQVHAGQHPMRIQRLSTNPVVHPQLDPALGDNINGPSLIRVPDWIDEPLGRYYLYFAHHDGDRIRLAYSDALEGPWGIHKGGVLPLEAALFTGHVASPDVHVDHARREIRLYYHGSDTRSGGGGEQFTRAAISSDGLNFTARPEKLGLPYFRAFEWGAYHYALAMPGVFYRSRSGLGDFERGPSPFARNMRHSALKLDGDTLSVFYTNIGDLPERILFITIALTPDWSAWTPSEPAVVLEPERDYEGAHLPRTPSVRGLAAGPLCQLRDPAIYRENGRTYLLYSVAGESGIAIAEICSACRP